VIGIHVVSVKLDVSSNMTLSDDSKLYYYRTVIPLQQEDLVVVEARDVYGVARVVGIEVNDPDCVRLASKWVVCKVDLSDLMIVKETEAKMKDLRNKMEQRRQKVEEISIYRTLAKEDKEMEELLHDFEELRKCQSLRKDS